MDIISTSKALPEPDEWTGSKQQTLQDAELLDDPDPEGAGPASDEVGSLDDGNDARDSDRNAGSV